MLTDEQLLTQLETLRDKAMDGDCDYSERQSRALEKIMDAIDTLSSVRKQADVTSHLTSPSMSTEYNL
ncbi:MAG: hypothetical protein KGI29_05280 [Pseudomonadota bacterium]|nr:hypothetical protein [Pseudomonadota bacterium]MDE3037028.1 hypothetical protein [Pseudomonadota bacterium]